MTTIESHEPTHEAEKAEQDAIRVHHMDVRRVVDAASKPLPVIEEACEMARLGVGKCRGLMVEADTYSLDYALRQVKHPWSFSMLSSSHGTYGYIAVLDKPIPSNRMYGGYNASFLAAVGVGHDPASAVMDALSKTAEKDAAIAAMPIDNSDL